MTKKELMQRIEELEEELEEKRDELDGMELDYATRKAVNMTCGIIEAFVAKGFSRQEAIELYNGIINFAAQQ